jgi:RNA polymerase sigma-70 factor (ECF subfamily)
MLQLEPTLTDGDPLLAPLRAGDAAAYETLVRRETPKLLAVARRLLRSEDDARDAVQDAFVSAFRSLRSFEGGCRISTWLHRITVNAALMRLRTRKRKPEAPIEDLLPTFLEDGHHTRHPHEWREDAFELLANRETRDFVRASIDQLPESYRTVLLLRDIEELDTPEVARVLGVSENLVKVRLHRARQALRSLLEPRFEKARA